MKNKRIISAVLAASALFTLAACGGGNGSAGGSTKPGVKDNGTINVMLLETGIGTDFLNEVADDFYNETGITVKVNSDTLIDEDLKNSMTLEGGVDDDIYMSGLTYNWIDWVNADTIEDLTDLCNEEYEDDINPGNSGGPVLAKIKDRIFVIGIVSKADGQATQGTFWVVPSTEIVSLKQRGGKIIDTLIFRR